MWYLQSRFVIRKPSDSNFHRGLWFVIVTCITSDVSLVEESRWAGGSGCSARYLPSSAALLLPLGSLVVRLSQLCSITGVTVVTLFMLYKSLLFLHPHVIRECVAQWASVQETTCWDCFWIIAVCCPFCFQSGRNIPLNCLLVKKKTKEEDYDIVGTFVCNDNMNIDKQNTFLSVHHNVDVC